MRLHLLPSRFFSLRLCALAPALLPVLLTTVTPAQTPLPHPALTQFLVGKEPSAIAVGDFNNDHKRDLAVANYGSNSFRSSSEIRTARSPPLSLIPPATSPAHSPLATSIATAIRILRL